MSRFFSGGEYHHLLKELMEGNEAVSIKSGEYSELVCRFQLCAENITLLQTTQYSQIAQQPHQNAME